MRFNTNVSANSKKSIELNNFLGVDFSSAPTNVSKNRASLAKNLISIDGVNQKRPGWEELFNFGEDVVINGVFINKFQRNGHIDEIMLVQANGKIYRIEENNGIWEARLLTLISQAFSEYDNAYDVFKNNTNFKSQAFMSKNKLYILGGGEYMVYAPKEEIEEFKRTQRILNDNGEYEVVDKIYNNGDKVELNGIVFLCKEDELNGNNYQPSGKLGVESYGWSSGSDYYVLSVVLNNESQTYIPTTTIGIMPIESGDNGRTSLDKINLLSSFRYNKLRGVGNDVEPIEHFIESYDIAPVEGKVYYIKNNLGEYTAVSSENLPSSFGKPYIQDNLYYEKVKSYSFKLDAEHLLNDHPMFIEIKNKTGNLFLTNGIHYTNIVTGLNKKVYHKFIFTSTIKDDSVPRGDLAGYIDLEKGILYLFDTIDIEPVDNSDNIEVKYVPYRAENIIKDCSFGCKFGYNGRDTLFLSGNKYYPNQDFYSYTVEEDFSYFPADNIESFGSATSAVKSYLQVSDGTLVILKEQYGSEPTIYYRTASYKTNELGAIVIQFPVTQGACGEGAVNAYTTGNLGGDNLFVSPNGIFGLALAENIIVNERYARERDRFIHSKLIKHDLSNAVATVYKGRYLLALDDVCYVLDSRFKSTSEEDVDDTFAYESWYWDNIPARCFCSYNNELYFGTKTGGLCKFTENECVDKYSLNIGIVDISNISSDGNLETVFSIDKHFKDNIFNQQKVVLKKEFTLDDKKYGIYINPFSFSKSSVTSLGGYTYEIDIFVDIENDFIIGQKIAVNNLGNCIGGYVTNIDGTKLTIETSGQIKNNRISDIYTQNIIDKPLYITNYKNESIDGEIYNSFNLCDENGDIIKVCGFSSSINPTIFCEIKEPVVAIWQSAILDLGLYDYSKCLDSLSVVLSPDYHGKVRFGYETKRVTLDLMAKQITGAETEQSHHFFDFDNIDFDNFTFESAFASSYTKRIRERNINYIMFKAVMDDDKNSALMSIKVDYTLYKKNRGVR